MAYLISKPTRREAEERRTEGLAKQGLSAQKFRGTARTAEEAHDTQRGLEREGETFDKFWAIDNNSAEAKQAQADTLRHSGINPETNERMKPE